MVKIRGILNASTLNVLEQEQGQSYIKSKYLYNGKNLEKFFF